MYQPIFYTSSWKELILTESISKRLIALLEKYNFSQTDIERQIGVTPALISAYENQERKPSIDKLVALADIFHVSTDYILGRSVKIDSSVMVNVDGLSDKQIEIIRNIISEFKGDSFLTKKRWFYEDLYEVVCKCGLKIFLNSTKYY